MTLSNVTRNTWRYCVLKPSKNGQSWGLRNPSSQWGVEVPHQAHTTEMFNPTVSAVVATNLSSDHMMHVWQY